MKYFVMIVMCMALAFSFTGCDKDKDGDGKETWSPWTTTDTTMVYTPQGKHIKLLSWGDIQDANDKCCAEPVRTKVREIGRWICSESKWVLVDYKPASKKLPKLFKAYVCGVWVSTLHPMTLELQTTNIPLRVKTVWVPNKDNSGFPIKDKAGEWVVVEPDCPFED